MLGVFRILVVIYGSALQPHASGVDQKHAWSLLREPLFGNPPARIVQDRNREIPLGNDRADWVRRFPVPGAISFLT